MVDVHFTIQQCDILITIFIKQQTGKERKGTRSCFEVKKKKITRSLHLQHEGTNLRSTQGTDFTGVFVSWQLP